MEGKKVLLVDADPQGSLSISLGFPQPDKIPSLGSIGVFVITITVAMVVGILSGCGNPRLMDKLPCGSASTSKTFFPSIASPVPT